MGWFKRAAGWQRFWFVTSLALLAASVVWLPALFEKEALERLSAARARVIAEFETPACQPVRSTPYTMLSPVPEGAPCHDVYVWRRTVTEKLPLILDHVLFPMDAHRREIWVAGALKASAMAGIGSALLYLALWHGHRRRAMQQ